MMDGFPSDNFKKCCEIGTWRREPNEQMKKWIDSESDTELGMWPQHTPSIDLREGVDSYPVNSFNFGCISGQIRFG